jgi:hypothetical protein
LRNDSAQVKAERVRRNRTIMTAPEPPKRFRVALSFPGERRRFVKRVAKQLAASLGQKAVLYDAWYEAEFARPDLDTYLQTLYHDQADLIAVFLCAGYERKEWCGLEWRAVRDLIKRRRSDSVMPLRWDDTEIQGLFSIDGYVWIGRRSPAEIAAVIMERLRLLDPSLPPPPPPDTNRRRLIIGALLAFSLTGLTGGLAWWRLQPPPVQMLAGTILDASGRPIPEVEVALPDQGLQTRTDALGHFTLAVPGREPRQVQLIATAPGVAPHRQYVLTGSQRLSFVMDASTPGESRP